MEPIKPQFGKPARRRIRAFDLGPNLIEHQIGAKRIKDVIWMLPEDRDAVIATYSGQNVALPLYKEHRPEHGSYGAVHLEVAPDGGLDQVVDYSPVGRALVESGAYMYDSPEIVHSAPDALGRKRLRDVRSASLVNVPARTGSQPLLMTARARGPMSTSADPFRRVLELGGQLQETFKELSGVELEQAKAVLEANEPIAKAIAAAQVAVQTLSPPAPTGETVQMSAAARDAATLGARVMKMTGSASADEAMGYLEAQDGTVKALSAKLVDYAIESGALPAAEADRFRAMSPGQLLGHLRAGVPAVVQMSAKPAASDGAQPPAAAKSQEIAESCAIAEEVAAGLLGPKLNMGSR